MSSIDFNSNKIITNYPIIIKWSFTTGCIGCVFFFSSMRSSKRLQPNALVNKPPKKTLNSLKMPKITNQVSGKGMKILDIFVSLLNETILKTVEVFQWRILIDFTKNMVVRRFKYLYTNAILLTKKKKSKVILRFFNNYTIRIKESFLIKKHFFK